VLDDQAVASQTLRLAEFISGRTGGAVIDAGGPLSQQSNAADVVLRQADDEEPHPRSAKLRRGWDLLVVPDFAGRRQETMASIERAGEHVHFSGTHGPGDGGVLVASSERPPHLGLAPGGYEALAIMTAYNEADIIEGILDRVEAEGLRVHFIDNWSTDDTLERAASHAAVVAAERFPDAAAQHYEWERLLHRVEEVAATAKTDWVVHHDADEWRTAAWPGVPMIDALFWAAESGFNAIDHTVVVHRPTDEQFVPGEDVTAALLHFEFGRRPGHFTQIKAWRSEVGRVDLASSGGHEARFPGRRVFPVNFLLRHYPIRSQAHGQQKVLGERRPRWSPAERRRGWHNQYDGVGPDTRFVCDPKELELFDEATFYQRFLFERLARIGIERPKG
jgi:hypothetical protein